MTDIGRTRDCSRNLHSASLAASLTPGPAELEGAITRFELTKRSSGDLEGTGAGLMLSGGDPQSGTAGYVAIETVTGTLAGRTGSFALQQLATLQDGVPTLHYVVVPGSGTGELTGIAGDFGLTIDADGTHHYELTYQLPD